MIQGIDKLVAELHNIGLFGKSKWKSAWADEAADALATLAKRLEELPSKALWDESRKALAEIRNENGALRVELEAVKAERDEARNYLEKFDAETSSLLRAHIKRATAAEARAAQLSEGFRSAICDLRSQGFDVSDLQKLWEKNQG